MAEPTTDDRDIDPGGDELDARRVAEGVRMHVLLLQRWQLLRCCAHVLRELEANTSGTERLTVPVDEHGCVLRPRLALEQGRQQCDRLWPEWADPLLAPLAVELHLRWRREPDAARA